MEFIKGMDVSMVKELEENGAVYRINGTQADLFQILKQCGTNMVRIRIWTDPYDENGNFITKDIMETQYPYAWEYLLEHKDTLLPKSLGGNRDVWETIK